MGKAGGVYDFVCLIVGNGVVDGSRVGSEGGDRGDFGYSEIECEGSSGGCN